MKTKEELNALKEEIETLYAKLAELSEEELAQVSGGAILRPGMGDKYRLSDEDREKEIRRQPD